MDHEAKANITAALRKAATILGRGPQSPIAVYRYGSKTNQAPVMKLLRDFLDVYAATGNALMSGEMPSEKIRQAAALRDQIKEELDDLVAALDGLT